ncbi:MAG: DNA (cytosine-5-)-methyltransferase [Dehalococcoidales bacterium]|nr:DNA (cytosine-5-)-methyltransferase [Dehalococcoidales bacterium]
MEYTHIDLFSGIGGFALAAQRAGFETILFCDNDKFCQKVLERRFNGEVITDTCQQGLREPQHNGNGQDKKKTGTGVDDRPQRQDRTFIPIIPDIRDVDGRKYRGATLLTGGFPCQPFSQTGKRKGKEDDRYLWDEMFRVIKEVQPRWVLAENVYGLLTIDNGLVFNKVLSDLESIGYEVQPLIIPACAVNAPHRRDRVWIVAHKQCLGRQERTGQGIQSAEQITEGQEFDNADKETSRLTTDTKSRQPRKQTQPEGREDIGGGDKETSADSQHKGLERRKFNEGQRLSGQHNRNRGNEGRGWEQNWIEVATCFCGVDDGLPAELDGLKLSKSKHREERLKALGNAIVPQVAYNIMKVIAEIENNDKNGI